MSNPIYSMTVEAFIPLLTSLYKNLDKAIEHAAAIKAKPDAFAEARLIFDMLPLKAQVIIACDHAKNGSARLAGVEAPKFEDDEKTMDELKARIAKTIDYLKTLKADQFKDAATRTVKFPLRGEMSFESNGEDYVRDWALPNFYFHIVTAYDILRANGVQIGKPNFMGNAARHFKKG